MLTNPFKNGDTIVEVSFAVVIFGAIAIGAWISMNSSLSVAQSTLESTLARDEIDGQADALRFIHASALSAEAPNEYTETWRRITENVNHSAANLPFDTCEEGLNQYKTSSSYNVFLLNPRNLDDSSAAFIDKDLIQPATVFPRILYGAGDETNEVNSSDRNATGAQGLWIVPQKGIPSGMSTSYLGYFDFYIYACWDEGGRTVPSTLSTVVRLYDPEGAN